MPPLVRRFSCITLLPKENAEFFRLRFTIDIRIKTEADEARSRRGELILE